MAVDKRNPWLNIIFGAFLLVSIAKGGIVIHDWNEKRKGKKSCNCAKK